MAALMQARLPSLEDRYVFQTTSRQVRSEGLDEDLAELAKRGMLETAAGSHGVDTVRATQAGTDFVRRIVADRRLDKHHLKGALEVAAEIERASGARPLREVVAEAAGIAG
jgi:hypothetical protein